MALGNSVENPSELAGAGAGAGPGIYPPIPISHWLKAAPEKINSQHFWPTHMHTKEVPACDQR